MAECSAFETKSQLTQSELDSAPILFSHTHTSVAVNFLYSQGHRMYLVLMKLVPSCTNLPLHILGRELFSLKLLPSKEAGVMMVTKPGCSTTGGCIDSCGICLSVVVGNDKRTLTKRLDFIFYKAHSRSFTLTVCMRLRKRVWSVAASTVSCQFHQSCPQLFFLFHLRLLCQIIQECWVGNSCSGQGSDWMTSSLLTFPFGASHDCGILWGKD